MKLISINFAFVIFALFSVDASPPDGLKIKANYGEDVTLNFPMDKAEEAGRLRITFTSETTKEIRLIAQNCTGSERCDFVETPGVKLRVGGRFVRVTVQSVNSCRSGLYEARAFCGKDVFEKSVTLVVKEAPVSSSAAPPHSSTPKPLNSDLHWLWLVFGFGLVFGFVLVFAVVILVVVCFWNHRRTNVRQQLMKKQQNSLLSPDPESAKEGIGNTIAVIV